MGLDNRQNKLTFKSKCGYASASVGDAVSYMFITTFLMFFLTTVAGLQPAVAGFLTAMGSLFDAIVNPIIGYISDHARTRWGRRCPFMIAFCLPLFAAIVLLYTAVEVNYTVKVIYYGIMILLFWTSFTGFFVPYYALGVEYTQDYDERATLRSYASFFNMIGTLFSMALPTMIVEFFSDRGMNEERAWQLTAVFLASVTVASILITAFVSKGKEHIIEVRPKTDTAKFSVKNMLKEYLEVLTLRPMKFLLAASLFYLIAYAMIMSDQVYLLTYNLEFNGNEISLTMVVRSLIIIAFIPIINRIVSKTDKRKALLAEIVFGIVGMTCMRFVDISNMEALALFIFFAAITTQTYWQIMPAIFYDVCEYDEFETGKRREGAIVSVQGFIEAIASGIGTQVLGIILQVAGFDGSATMQNPGALNWVYNCTTWVPAIFLLGAGVALYKYPITKEVYEDIVKKLEVRKLDKL